MSFSVNRTDTFPDIAIYSLGVGATTIKEGHIPLAQAVPPVKTGVGNGFLYVYGTLYGYDGTSSGYQQANFKVETGSPAVITNESFTSDATVPMTVSLVLDSRGDLAFTVTNNSTTKVIDCLISGITVKYVQP